MRECWFFGYLLTLEGMSIIPKKVNDIMQLGAPKCKKELESFQIMVNYLKHYASWLVHVAEPLKELLRNEMLQCWESKDQEAFKAIKEELAKTRVLAYFNPKADHIIQVDGSMNGLGDVLMQRGRPVTYVLRTLTPAEIGYFNIKRELLSIVFGL